jgi:predicted Ser/Thr protein kinase
MVSAVGELFAGRYALGEVLGSGGSGLVRRAHDTLLDRDVAIKLLKAGLDDDVLRARLRAEAQLAGSLHHPSIAQVFDFGEVEGTPYIVMEYVPGTSLWHLLREHRTLPLEQVLDLVAQVASALQVAHAAGIVHRDLKPSNILVTDEGRAVIVDFGIARTADAEPLTSTGTIVGTVDYISPEQVDGRSATPRSDLYSLGMLAYECLTGCKPFRRESPVATALAVLHDEVAPLTDVPPPVAELVAHLVSKRPEERPVDGAEVAARATAALGATSEPTRVLPPPPSRATVRSTAVPPWRTALRSRRLQVGAALVIATLVVAGFVAARPSAPRMPDLAGLQWSAASAALEDAGITYERVLVDDPVAERGTVLGQDPRPGAQVGDGTSVVVEVASGRTTLRPADVVGESYKDAARTLVALGLVPVRADVIRAGGTDLVAGARPTGRLEVGSMVTLTVASAPAVDPAVDPGAGSGSGTDDGTRGKPGKGEGRGKGKKKGH